jgi:hypothetical protein
MQILAAETATAQAAPAGGSSSAPTSPRHRQGEDLLDLLLKRIHRLITRMETRR